MCNKEAYNLTTIKIEKLDPKAHIKYQCCKKNVANYLLRIGLNREYLCNDCLNRLTKALNDISADRWLEEETDC
jgi:hypothetical protein